MSDAPCPAASQRMAQFDVLPKPYRAFLAEYPRGVKSDQAAALLRACAGNVDKAIMEIRAVMFTRA